MPRLPAGIRRPVLALAAIAWPAMAGAPDPGGPSPSGPAAGGWPAGARVFAVAGLGLVDTRTDLGATIPLGVSVLVARQRLLASANLLEIGLLAGDRRNSRYYRPYPGYSYCMDGNTGQWVADYNCAASTDLSASASFALSWVVLDEVWLADKAAKLTLGMGYRLRRPADPFARVGLLFPSRRGAAGASLDLGPGFVGMGASWGLDLGRALSRRAGQR